MHKTLQSHFMRFISTFMVIVLLVSNIPIFSSTVQASSQDPAATKALEWLENQIDPPTYPSDLSFNKSYSSDYEGDVAGRVDLSSIPDPSYTNNPYISTDQSYSSGYEGTVSGRWSGIKSSELSSYRVVIFDKTDIGYKVAESELNSDGTWISDKEVTFHGEPIVALINNSNEVVTRANQTAGNTLEG